MLIIDQEKCIQCETCVEECNSGCLKLEGEEIVFDPARCSYCGHCLSVCPRGSIMIDGDGYSCEDVMEFPYSKKLTPEQMKEQIMMRRSVRRFTDDPVTEDELAQLLDAAKYAPTARNSQGNVLLVMETKEGIDKLRKETLDIVKGIGDAMAEKNPGLAGFFKGVYNSYYENGKDRLFYDAPLVIYVFADDDVNGAICASNIGNMASALRLGYCYVQLPTDAFKNEDLKKEYEIPEGKKCVLALLIGHSEPEYFCSVPRKTPVTIKR